MATSLASSAIINALQKYGTRGSQGIGANLRRTMEKVRTQSPNPDHLALARDIENAPQAPQVLRYDHPGDSAPGTTPAEIPGKGPISDADVAWLQRLPTDPASVTFDDARSAIAMQKRDNLPKDQQRLIDSIVNPILEAHDGAAAGIALHNAQQAVPLPLPQSALPALTSAIAAEIPALTPGEALARAAQHIDQISADRYNTYLQRFQTAQSKVNELQQRRIDRTATTRPLVGITRPVGTGAEA